MSDYSVPDRATAAYLSVRQYVRDFGNEVDEGLTAACRIAVAEELRRLANLNDVIAQVARVWLLQSANALDPEGATR